MDVKTTHSVYVYTEFKNTLSVCKNTQCNKITVHTHRVYFYTQCIPAQNVWFLHPSSCVVCMCGVVKARWCLHCFLIAKMPGLQCLPGAKPPAGTSCCQYKHTQLPLVYKEGWSLVASVQPGHQSQDVTKHR